MSNNILSALNKEDLRYTIMINSEDVLTIVCKIREIIREEIDLEYKKKLSEEYLTRDEMVEKFKITKSVLDKWNRTNFLVPVKVGGKTLYRKSDVVKVVSEKEKIIPTRQRKSRMV